MKILAIETFYGGAHKQFIDELISFSSHDFTLVTLPDELWKWRLKTAAFEIAQLLPAITDFDLLFVTDLINLNDLRSHIAEELPPIVLYFHENQHSYPPEQGRNADFHIRWIDFTNAVTANRILFNSHFQMNSFLDELPRFLKEIPCSTTDWVKQIFTIRSKSSVIYPGVNTPAFKSCVKEKRSKRVVWNHRWEYDKNPGKFLRVMNKIQALGTDFELVLLGESQKFPSSQYDNALNSLSDKIVHRGWVSSRAEYFELLQSSDIVISTSNQENFGLSVVEAILCGCFPVLPHRLAYPEVIPTQFHKKVLYHSEKELVYRLNKLLTDTYIPETDALQKELTKHHWSSRIQEFDSLFEETVKK